MNAIVTHGLTKVYRSQFGRTHGRSLDALDLEIGANEVFGFLGRNGAGKTTTIKILCSLLRPTSGEAFIHGENVRTRASRRLIGYLPENPYFYEYLTPRETIDFYGRLQGLSAAQRKTAWDTLGGLLDLHSISEERVRGFSKGMRQRLGFAVALVGDPQVVILDEPMSGLDPLGRRATRELILRLRDEGKTVFFSSHVLGDVQQICSKVGILVKGRLTSQGRIDELLTQRIQRVEVIADGLTAPAAETVAAGAESTRRSEAGHHFFYHDLDAANAAVRAIHAGGGSLVEFTPVRESLEDYFMHEQEKHS
ncbi:MAG: ABC transporter ATP-binding protein [Candidatus Hydrogenedentes bacterium]|nr:ABC transporter ATP-binding protein [Candidatus Hydrogenedentota bacterium]